MEKQLHDKIILDYTIKALSAVAVGLIVILIMQLLPIQADTDKPLVDKQQNRVKIIPVNKRLRLL